MLQLTVNSDLSDRTRTTRPRAKMPFLGRTLCRGPTKKDKKNGEGKKAEHKRHAIKYIFLENFQILIQKKLPDFFSAWFRFQVFDGELPMIILKKDKENCSTYWTKLQFLPSQFRPFLAFCNLRLYILRFMYR